VAETLELIAGSRVLDLTDDIKYTVTGYDGFGMAPVKRVLSKGPDQHGVFDQGFTLEPRSIVLGIFVHGNSDLTYRGNLAELLAMLRPSRNTITLRYTFPSGDQFSIDCFYSADLDLPSKDRHGTYQRTAVGLLCPDPTWYGAEQTAIFVGAGGSQTMDVPLVIPWKVGGLSMNMSQAVVNSGSWEAWPIVEVTGPIDACVITNESSGDSLDFTGYSITAGTVVRIDTRYGYKTVTKVSDGSNLIDKLTAASDLATFRLLADPDVTDGINSVRISGTAISAATFAQVSWASRYIGIPSLA
jgi:hypothetical protein